MNDEEFSNKILGIFVCFMYSFIALFTFFAIAISRVDAADVQLGFGGDSYNFSVGNDIYVPKLTYPVVQYRNYYRFTSNPLNLRDSFGVHAFNLFGVTPIDVSQFDYAYINVISSNSFVVSGFATIDYDRAYGYAMTSNFTNLNEYSDKISNPCYQTIIKVDLSNVNTIGGLFTFYLTSLNVETNYDLWIDYRIYLGTNGDDVSSVITENNNQNTEKVIEAITGGELKDNTQPDDTKLNDYSSAEGNLIDKDKLGNIDNLEVAIDSNSNTYVWNVVNRTIQTHPKIFAMIITMLSVGIIKLILNR
ncbi:MAG: hypothetical protein K2H20_03440 [Bacilli bacterium]|nr:hypothetical protein [Bacilli bacterium]